MVKNLTINPILRPISGADTASEAIGLEVNENNKIWMRNPDD